MVNNRVLLLLILVCFILVSCKKEIKKQENDFQSIVIGDVVGDNKLDTIIMTDKDGTTIISLKQKKQINEIIQLSPMFEGRYKTSKPPIENVYIEPNNIQSDNKGLRVIARNTDVHPDYYFIDMHFKDKWNIENVGVINTTDSVYIKKANIKISVHDVYGEGSKCNLSGLVLEYIKLTE